MHCYNRITTILFLLLAALHQARGNSVDSNTVSITAEVAYGIEPACVQTCLFDYFPDTVEYLLAYLGCHSTIYNACYCTQIVDQTASTVLSSCISNAISLYESYCVGAGYPHTVAAAQTTSSSPSSSPASQSAIVMPASTSLTSAPSATRPSSSIPTTPSIPTAPTTPSSIFSSTVLSANSSSTASTSSSNSNTGAIAGGVVGGLAALAIIAGIIYFLLRRNQQKLSQATYYQEPPRSTIRPPMEQPEKQPIPSVSPVSSEGAPSAVYKHPGSGKAELHNNANTPVVSNATSTPLVAAQSNGRYGLRSEELDSSGRLSEAYQEISSPGKDFKLTAMAYSV
ncbi:hypothetical protein G7Y89_g6370 [Cudoniella acicularis]|uniref:Epidermal growth factor receptor-like transmembrane-juxtamembrane segment domain-containing protein n=1 Tax=Cudoniella acicularis TaxID=354080 RepID=A0A8H4W2Y1_9HELO|nr:hypothetical protein G7Y89_g6370 [Cudoniella acicularis]